MATRFVAKLESPDGRGIEGFATDCISDLAVAVTAGVKAAADGMKTDLRAMIESAGLGERLPNAIRTEVYPKGRPSIHAAAFIYPRGKGAQTILEAFSQGVTIRSNSGRFLAVPTPEAGAGRFGTRLTPELWEQRTGIRLKFIYRRGGPSLLVADLRARAGKRGGFATPSARAGKTGRGLTTVPIFILLPQVTLAKRLNPKEVARRWSDRVPELIRRGLPSNR